MAAPAYSFLRVMVQTRARGHHALAATAYRFALNVTADDGREWHYARRGGVAASGSALPEGAARRWADPILWASEIEAAERRRDSRLMRDDVLGIPVALVAAGNAYEVVAEYARRVSRLRRTPVHFALHPPPRGDSSNWHAHVVYAGRQLTVDGESFARKRDRRQDREELIDQHKAIWSGVCAEYGVEVDFSGPVSEQPLAHLGPQAAAIERMAARRETAESLAAAIRETGGQVDDLRELASAAQAAHGDETISELLARDRAPVTTAARHALRPKPSRRAVHEHACTQLGAWTPPRLDPDDFPEPVPVRHRPRVVEVSAAPVHRPRAVEVSAGPVHRPRAVEVSAGPVHRPRAVEVSAGPVHRPRAVEASAGPVHRPRAVEASAGPVHRPRAVEASAGPVHRPRAVEASAGPVHRPRAVEVSAGPVHRPRAVEVSAGPVHRPRAVEVSAGPVHRPRAVEVSAGPVHRPRAVEVSAGPVHRPRAVEVSAGPVHRPRAVEASAGPVHRPRVVEASAGPVHRPRAVEVSAGPVHRPRAVEVSAGPVHRPRAVEASAGPVHRPRAVEVSAGPVHRPRAVEAVPAPRHPRQKRRVEHIVRPSGGSAPGAQTKDTIELDRGPPQPTPEERSHVIKFLAGGGNRQGLNTQLNQLALVSLDGSRPMDRDALRRKLTPDTARYVPEAITPAPGSTAPFVSRKSADIAARMLWTRICQIAKRWYRGRTSPPPEDEWPGFRAPTRAKARKQAIEDARAEWRAHSDSFAADVQDAVLEFEVDRWREFNRQRESAKREKSMTTARRRSRKLAQRRSATQGKGKNEDSGHDRW